MAWLKVSLTIALMPYKSVADIATISRYYATFHPADALNWSQRIIGKMKRQAAQEMLSRTDPRLPGAAADRLHQ
jgi:hypothetical protein